jgi:hypothetical protein
MSGRKLLQLCVVALHQIGSVGPDMTRSQLRGAFTTFEAFVGIGFAATE